jgi:hypothetical protein
MRNGKRGKNLTEEDVKKRSRKKGNVNEKRKKKEKRLTDEDVTKRCREKR